MSVISSIGDHNLLQEPQPKTVHSTAKLQPMITFPQKTSSQILTQIYKIIDDQNAIKFTNKQKKNSFDESHSTQSWKCKCKKTRCLKLYCECFAIGEYCKDCNCTDCHNLIQYDNERAQAIDQALMRDPNAFDGKAKQRKGGCICKKTGCIKKYCQCYNSGQVCTSECKCLNCQNCIRSPKQNNEGIEGEIHYQEKVNLQFLTNQIDN